MKMYAAPVFNNIKFFTAFVRKPLNSEPRSSFSIRRCRFREICIPLRLFSETGKFLQISHFFTFQKNFLESAAVESGCSEESQTENEQQLELPGHS